jgi:hypothetical protein
MCANATVKNPKSKPIGIKVALNITNKLIPVIASGEIIVKLDANKTDFVCTFLACQIPKHVMVAMITIIGVITTPSNKEFNKALTNWLSLNKFK